MYREEGSTVSTKHLAPGTRRVWCYRSPCSLTNVVESRIKFSLFFPGMPRAGDVCVDCGGGVKSVGWGLSVVAAVAAVWIPVEEIRQMEEVR